MWIFEILAADPWVTIWLIVLILVCGIGVVIMSLLVLFFVGSNTILARRLQWVFLSDMLIYLTSITGGVFLLIGPPALEYIPLQAIEIIRIVSLIINLWVAIKLYRYFHVVN